MMLLHLFNHFRTITNQESPAKRHDCQDVVDEHAANMREQKRLDTGLLPPA